MSRSGIYTANTAAQVLTVEGTIEPGTIVRRYGSNVNLIGNGITVSGTGYYVVDISVTLAATAIGLVGIELKKDGLPVVGATAVETATGGGDTINLSTSAIVRNACCNARGVLTVELTNGDATVNNISIVVTKM